MSTTDGVIILMVCHNHCDLSNVKIVNTICDWILQNQLTHTQQQDARFTTG